MLRLIQEVTDEQEGVWSNGNTRTCGHARECAKEHSFMSHSLPRRRENMEWTRACCGRSVISRRALEVIRYRQRARGG